MRSTALLFLLLLLLVPAAAFSAAGTVPVHMVQADFAQTKELKILARPLLSSGYLIFQAPDNLRWEYLHPVHSVLLLHDGVVKKFIARSGELTEEPRTGMDAMQVVLAEISNWLDGRFTDNKAFAVSRNPDGIILLTPKNEGMRSFIQSIELKPGSRPGLLESVTLREGPDSLTRFTFADARINQPVDDGAFTVP